MTTKVVRPGRGRSTRVGHHLRTAGAHRFTVRHADLAREARTGAVSSTAFSAVAGRVAAGASEFGFFDEGPLGLFEVGDVVVLHEVGAAAVDAVTVAFLDDELLSFGVVAMFP